MDRGGVDISLRRWDHKPPAPLRVNCQLTRHGPGKEGGSYLYDQGIINIEVRVFYFEGILTTNW